MRERGRWDRTATASERAESQRRTIVLAAARAVFESGRAVTVSDVIRRAGVGRNTFYAHFHDLPAALAEAEDAGVRRVEQALSAPREVRTPVERLRRLAADWLDLVCQDPELVSLALYGDGRRSGAQSRARAAIADALRATSVVGRAAGVIGRPVDEIRLLIASHAFFGAAELVIEGRRSIDLQALGADLVEASLRLLR